MGKTQAICSLSETSVLTTEAMNTDQQAHHKPLITVGIDYGEIKLEGDLVVGLYGTLGQQRFDFVWSVICKGAIGAVILIDHSRRSSLEDLKFYINAFKDLVDNIIICITHVDEDAQQLLKKYRNWLSMQNHVMPSYAIDARKKDDVLLMVEALIARAEVKYS